MGYQIAQINVGRIVAAMDSAAMHGFAARLDEINALAERMPGFVWRLTSAGGNDATSIHGLRRPVPADQHVGLGVD